MKSKQTMFFAVFDDIEQILVDIESTLDIHYYKAGLFDSKIIPTFNSIFDAPNLGITTSGDWNRIDRYIVSKRETAINIREIQQRSGGVKFAVDQMINPDSLELKIGGVYQKKENVLIAGRVATISATNDSNKLYKSFSARIKKEFKKTGAFYIGQIAERKLKEGWRLVINEGAPKAYDLTLNQRF